MDAIFQLLVTIFFIYLMYQLMKYIFKLLFNVMGTASTSRSIFSHFTSMPTRGILNFFSGISSDGMMKNSEANRFLNPLNKGVVLDGKNKRLSTKDSFNHMGIIARTGGGKTTGYIIPNILKFANNNNSMIVTDLSGELYQKTSGYLKKKGFKVYVLDPEDLNVSLSYNPLYYALDSISIDEIVNVLIKSSNPGEVKQSDKIWLDGAKTFLNILIKALIGTKDHRYINLANVKYLINSFGEDGKKLDEFMYKYLDKNTFNGWKGFVSGNKNTVLSFVSTANMALNDIGINENLALLTANHTINFKKFREEKSILYIRIPAQKQEQYSFLLNLFYKQFFNSMMQSLPTKQDLPIYCLLDEFGNLMIPGFSRTITVIRKYKVSISIVIQDFSQLEEKYGKHEAHTILNGGLTGKLFFSGAGLEVTKMLKEMIGDRYVNRMDDMGKHHHVKEHILSDSDIRTMDDNEALFLYGNKLPLKIKIKPYYKDFVLNSYTKYPPSKSKLNKAIKPIEYVDIRVEI